MRKSILSPFVTIGAIFGLVLAMFAGSVAVFGQATPAAEGDTPIHPAHIHAGVCPEVGDVVFPLENVVQAGLDNDDAGMGTPAMGTPAADATMTGTPMLHDMGMGLESTTVVEASLDDILGAEHAINLHLSPEELSVYVACGDITGEVENDQLVVELQELNDSGVSGHATLTDNGDGTTTVLVEVTHVSSNMSGTPESTPKP